MVFIFRANVIFYLSEWSIGWLRVTEEGLKGIKILIDVYFVDINHLLQYKKKFVYSGIIVKMQISLFIHLVKNNSAHPQLKIIFHIDSGLLNGTPS